MYEYFCTKLNLEIQKYSISLRIQNLTIAGMWEYYCNLPGTKIWYWLHILILKMN